MTIAVKGSAAGGKTAWKIFFALMLTLAAVWLLFPSIRGSELALGWIGAAWAFCSFWQQQDLEKTRFFFEMFNRFNERYNVLNDNLDRIAKQDGPLDASDRQIVVDYFNLCAEEYMFYRRGYIPEDVWASWSNGIRYYKCVPRFVTAWREERSTKNPAVTRGLMLLGSLWEPLKPDVGWETRIRSTRLQNPRRASFLHIGWGIVGAMWERVNHAHDLEWQAKNKRPSHPSQPAPVPS